MLISLSAAKYKEYNKARDILSGKLPLAPLEPKLPPHHTTPRKRKHEDISAGLQASKRLQLQVNKTPSKSSLQPWEVDPYDSPSMIRNFFTPSKKTIGPTPQKDGVVLGLFDLLQEESTPPSNSQNSKVETNGIQATPRKVQNEPSLKHSRTPASAGKRYLLDSFATPLKSKTLNGGQGGKTPSSVSKLHFSTPSFLRRNSHRPQPPVTESETLELSPQMVRVPRKPLVRGLSSMLAGLRKLEEEAADEDLDALREMEAEEAGVSKPKPATKMKENAELVSMPEILVEDSQGVLMGGFDDEAMLDSEPEEEKGRDGQPLKVYKKKGQKRTTRRVKMKPTRAKPATPQALGPQETHSEDELAAPDEEAVPETQVDDTTGFGEGRNFDSDSQSEYTASEGGTRYRRPNQGKKNKQANKDGKIKTAARKVTAMANQNFKRLKLRNSGAKGGPAHNSRFRRKR